MINLVTDEVFDSSTSCVFGLRRVARFQALLPSELIRHLRATIHHGIVALCINQMFNLPLTTGNVGPSIYLPIDELLPLSIHITFNLQRSCYITSCESNISVPVLPTAYGHHMSHL